MSDNIDNLRRIIDRLEFVNDFKINLLRIYQRSYQLYYLRGLKAIYGGIDGGIDGGLNIVGLFDNKQSINI